MVIGTDSEIAMATKSYYDVITTCQATWLDLPVTFLDQIDLQILFCLVQVIGTLISPSIKARMAVGDRAPKIT
jgi:hypothetical protein